MENKHDLRKRLREARRAHVEALPDVTRGLLFRHPPSPVLDRVPAGAVIGLYQATPFEAPTGHYAQFFHERGHRVVLPRFTDRTAAMEFAAFADPLGESELEPGPFGQLQPVKDAETLTPTTIFAPLLGFTARCERIGQGGGHYDTWLAANGHAAVFGLAWDCQLVDSLPVEPHDQTLDAVITPTRLYEA